MASDLSHIDYAQRRLEEIRDAFNNCFSRMALENVTTKDEMQAIINEISQTIDASRARISALR